MCILVKFVHTLCRNSNNSYHTEKLIDYLANVGIVMNVYWLTKSTNKEVIFTG